MKKLFAVLVVLVFAGSVSAFTHGVDDQFTIGLWHMDTTANDLTFKLADGVTDWTGHPAGWPTNPTYTPDDDSNFDRPNHHLFMGHHISMAPEWQASLSAGNGIGGSDCLYYDGDSDGGADGALCAIHSSPEQTGAGDVWDTTIWPGSPAVEVQLWFNNPSVGFDKEFLIGKNSTWEIYCNSSDGTPGGTPVLEFWTWTTTGYNAVINLPFELGQWNHVRAAYSAADGMVLELNGVPGGDVYNLAQTDLKPGTFLINTGSKDGNRAYTGYLDEVQVWNIPEPATFALLAIGGFVIRRKRA